MSFSIEFIDALTNKALIQHIMIRWLHFSYWQHWARCPECPKVFAKGVRHEGEA